MKICTNKHVKKCVITLLEAKLLWVLMRVALAKFMMHILFIYKYLILILNITFRMMITTIKYFMVILLS